jgi:hypothetical protein
MQIAARDAHVGVANSIPDLGQSLPTSQGVANDRVTPALDGQGLEPSGARLTPCDRTAEYVTATTGRLRITGRSSEQGAVVRYLGQLNSKQR